MIRTNQHAGINNFKLALIVVVNVLLLLSLVVVEFLFRNLLMTMCGFSYSNVFCAGCDTFDVAAAVVVITVAVFL